MPHQSKSGRNGESKDAEVEAGPWRTLIRLAHPFRTRILIIIGLVALSTGATLIEPLIYRVAINDVAGLFVRKAQEQTEQQEEETSAVQATELTGPYLQQVAYQITKPHVTPDHKVHRREKNTRHHAQYVEPHRRGHVSPRTPEQTL